MRDIMIDRGPDDAGIYISDHIGMGHRRLSIIDLTEAGRQPMSNEDGSVWMVINGEIYNHIELKTQLEKVGHVFKSRTDSEVVVHGYEEWGYELFEKLNGMFALALWNVHKEELILCRDRVGKKPLFYCVKNGLVVFSSDIKSIVYYLDDIEIDEMAMDCYLAHICVPQAHGIIKGIQKIKPAHYTVFSKGSTVSYRYWNLSFKEKVIMSDYEYMERTLELLKRAINDRLTSDVAIGAFLSGGIDSSLIVALMSQLSAERISTFSVGFDYQPFNELKHARMVADRYGTDHHEFTMEVNCIDILPKLVWYYGEPFADSSAIPSYYVSKIAREFIKVALAGDGGDETFGGYDRTQNVFRSLMYRKIVPHFVSRRFVTPFFNAVGDITDRFYLLNRIRYYENYSKNSIKSQYKNLMGFIHERDELYSARLKEKLQNHHPAHIYEYYYDESDGNDEVDKVLSVDINTILPDDYQVKMDIASMSNSLEVRAPFLDYRIIEFSSKIPSGRKLHRWKSKYLLKKLAERYMPRENIYRQKQGFAVPIAEWFRNELKPYLYSITLSEKAKERGYFNYDYVKHILDEHMAGRGYHEHKIWSLLWLELWHRMFIDRDITKDNTLRDLL